MYKLIIFKILIFLTHLNFFKYTFEGSITINFFIDEFESNHMEISIIDTGVGIPEYILNKLF